MIFIDALTYPIRKNAWMMIVLGALLSIVLHVAQFAPLIGGIVAILSSGYFGAYYLDIVGTTMVGRDEAPEWPDTSSYIQDILMPFIELTVLVILSFSPVLALVLFSDDEASWYGPSLLGLGFLGCCYFPLAVIASQAMGNLKAALPHIVLPGILKALPGYLGVVIALVVVFFLVGVTKAFTSGIPVIGWFLTPAVSIYGLMFQGRLIGLVYVSLRDKLGWD